jgi:hypothetical protein
MARPTALWGNPDSATFRRDYLAVVTFMGHKVLWHKWAVAPLMAVQTDIRASGTTYKFSDVQTYCNRNIAGSRVKSNHSWALAVDINPAKNPMGSKLVTDIPAKVREIFKAHGFKWGGDYKSKKDAMHFEYLGLPVKEEADDMTDEQDKRLKKLEVSNIARSYDFKILSAKIDGNAAEATRLASEKEAKVTAAKAALGI